MSKVPYERFVAFIAGPLSGAIGFGVTELVTHCGVLNEIAKGHEADISRSIVQATTFGVTTLVSYAAHHQWMSNLAKWWDSDAAKAEATVETVTKTIDPGASDAIDASITDLNTMVNEILTGERAQEVVQTMHGSDPATVEHFGAPNAEPVAPTASV